MHPLQKETPEKYCAFCGKKMERSRYPSGLEDLGAFKRRKYCSMDCMKRGHVKKGKNEQLYSPAHHSARKVAYMIDTKKYVCEICGATENIDVHHKDGNYQNNSSDNLVTLCRSCHMKIHRKKAVCVLCGKPVKGHGYCNMHYIRFKKYGDPLFCRGRNVTSTHTDRY